MILKQPLDTQSLGLRTSSVLPVVAFITFLSITFIGWYQANRLYEHNRFSEFERLVDKVERDVTSRMQSYENALWGGVGLFAASQSVEVDEWKAYVDALMLDSTYPGANGVGYISAVKKESLSVYVEEAVKNVHPDFEVVNVPNGIKNVDELSDRFIIRYISPPEKNRAALGLDIGSEMNRRNAAEKARDTGTAQLTDVIFLVQDNEKQAGFLLLLPVYQKGAKLESVRERRQAIQGWVYAPFMGRYMTGDILNSVEGLRVNVYDGLEVNPEKLIFGNLEVDYAVTRLRQVRPVNLAGKVWTLEVAPTEKFLRATRRDTGNIILAGGVLVSFLILWIGLLLTRSYARAVKIAKEMTYDLRKSEERYELAVKGSSDGLWDWDLKTNQVYYSPRFKELIGFEKEEMGSELEDWKTKLHPEDAEGTLQAIEEHLKNRKPYDVEYRMRHKDGHYEWFRARGKAFFDEEGKPYRMAGSITNITLRKNAEFELERQKEDLEKVNVELDRFVYTASHDLRAPLRGISSFATFLEEDYKNKLDDEGKDYLAEIRLGVDQMNRLINDLLELSRISRIKAPFERIDMKVLIADVLQYDKFDIENLKAEIQIQEGMPEIIGDKIKLRAVFRNLIRNALKFSSKGGCVPQVFIGYKDGSEAHEFFVRDNGIGIEAKHQSKVFDLFTRLQPKSQYEGTGAGLAIAKKAVEDHSGKIWVNPDFKDGAEIHFEVSKNLKVIEQEKAA